GATAVALNLTATGASAVTYVSACPGGTPTSTCRLTSAFNPTPAADTSNNALLQLGGPNHDQVLLYNNAGSLSLFADVLGYFVPPLRS
ncbi:MAG TPA: hypothetical protein VGK35_01860, partial [Actinotalea sp.]